MKTTPNKIRTKRVKSRVGTAIVGRIPKQAVDYIFKVPNTAKGRKFIADLESYMLPLYSVRLRGGALDKAKFDEEFKLPTKDTGYGYFRYGVPVRYSKTIRIYIHANNDNGKRGTPIGYELAQELIRTRKRLWSIERDLRDRGSSVYDVENLKKELERVKTALSEAYRYQVEYTTLRNHVRKLFKDEQ